MKKLIVTLSAVAGLVAAPVLRFDTASGRAQEYRRRANTPEYEGKSNWVVNPVLPTNFFAQRIDFFRVEGTNVVEMSQAEKDAITTAEAAAAVTAAKEAAKAAYDAGAVDRAIVKVLLDELNALRTQQAFLLMELNKAKANINNWRAESAFATNGWPARTGAQARTAILNELDNQP